MSAGLPLELWLSPVRIRVGLDARRVEDVAAAAAQLIATAAGADTRGIEAALLDRIASGDFAIGDGVAVPHAEVHGLDGPLGALVTTRQRFDVGALDGAPADIFFAVVAPPGDPVEHLHLLADLALLSRSPLLRTALRRADSADEAWSLLQAAAPRQLQKPSTGADGDSRRLLAVVSIAGEHAVDALLVELLAQGFDSAAVLDAQTLQDAATSEVPLFADFRELFGDPGGRRIFLLEIEPTRRDWLIEVARRICEERKAAACNVVLLPLAATWQWRPATADEAPSGH